MKDCGLHLGSLWDKQLSHPGDTQMAYGEAKELKCPVKASKERMPASITEVNLEADSPAAAA